MFSMPCLDVFMLQNHGRNVVERISHNMNKFDLSARSFL